MTDYFTDSSAIVKRYVAETGSPWMRTICASRGNTIILSEIALAEVAAAFAAAQRNMRITADECRDSLGLLIGDAASAYQLLPVQRAIIDRAVELTQRHRLRGYDAVQLASALEVERVLRRGVAASLTFLSADADLVTAAVQEGLAAENPNTH
ncbi:MAG: type II toxin-antitoxin system VapC family toxin [Chloroflexi bacterium]|nr:type II toxin-antitoxin system VapC family toxin [Chloroflexota bacterium]